MRFIRIFLVLAVLFSSGFAKDEKITLNFNNTPIEDVIKFTGKVLDTNILVSERISGQVNFLSQQPIEKRELLPF